MLEIGENKDGAGDVADLGGDLIGLGIAVDETAQLKAGTPREWRRSTPGAPGRGELRQCAMKRTAVSPAQRAEMRGVISGSDG